jgi:hypothetical protein
MVFTLKNILEKFKVFISVTLDKNLNGMLFKFLFHFEPTEKYVVGLATIPWCRLARRCCELAEYSVAKLKRDRH